MAAVQWRRLAHININKYPIMCLKLLTANEYIEFITRTMNDSRDRGHFIDKIDLRPGTIHQRLNQEEFQKWLRQWS